MNVVVTAMSYMGNQTRHLLIHNNWNAIGGATGLALNPKVNFLNFWENSGNGNFNARDRHACAQLLAYDFQARQRNTPGRRPWTKIRVRIRGSVPFQYAVRRMDALTITSTNAFKLFGLWQPVFFHDQSWQEKGCGGWSLSGIWNMHSGFPWNPIYNTTGVYYQGAATASFVRHAIVSGYGTKTSNKHFQQATNPNYGGNGTKFFAAPSYVQGANFPGNIACAGARNLSATVLTGPTITTWISA